MFSLERIQKKINRGKQKSATNKSGNTEKKSDGSFINLKTNTLKYWKQSKEVDDDPATTESYNSNEDCKVGTSWRFYNALKNDSDKQKLKLPVNDNQRLPKKINQNDDSIMLHKPFDVQERIRRNLKTKHYKQKIQRRNFLQKRKKLNNSKDESRSFETNCDSGESIKMDKELENFYEAIQSTDLPGERITMNSSAKFPNQKSNLNLAGPDNSPLSKESSTYNPSKSQSTEIEEITIVDAKIRDNSVLVAVYPGKKLYIVGNYFLKVIVGSVSVLGYVLKEGEEEVVFSPSIASILSIDITSGSSIKGWDPNRIESFCLPFEWIQDFDVKKHQLLCVIEIRKYESNMTRMLSGLRGFVEVNSFDVDLWKEIVGVQLVANSKRFRLFREPPEWSQYIEETLQFPMERTSIVVTGGKNVGKSTFVKFLLNTLMSKSTWKEVACLDIDPGQPEFSVSSCVSLSVIKSPLLGPTFTHWDQLRYVYRRVVFLGDIQVANVLREYLHIVAALMEQYKSSFDHVPLIVNTMGYTAKTGFDIMVDILRIVQPSHVITIKSQFSEFNFEHDLDCDLVSNIDRGILNIDSSNLKYLLTTFVTGLAGKIKTPSKYLREINTMAYLSLLWNANETNIIGETCRVPVVVKWPSVAVHIHGSFVPQNRVFQAINASFVALCKLDHEYLQNVSSDYPLQIQDYWAWFSLNTCLAWGIVKGIDPLTGEIFILTSLDQQTVTNEVNVIAMPKLPLPEPISDLFNKETSPYRQKCFDNIVQ